MFVDRIVSIQCRRCERKWNLSLPRTDREITAFAAICDCGEVFAGNRANSREGRILTNGAFDLIDVETDLPSLRVE